MAMEDLRRMRFLLWNMDIYCTLFSSVKPKPVFDTNFNRIVFRYGHELLLD
jgi:hypothetical protein